MTEIFQSSGRKGIISPAGDALQSFLSKLDIFGATVYATAEAAKRKDRSPFRCLAFQHPRSWLALDTF
jgi:hypothetical protein